jgi:hypothetical protein
MKLSQIVLGSLLFCGQSWSFDFFKAMGDDQVFKTLEGVYEKNEDLGEGTFCKKEQKYKVSWKVDVVKADASFIDPSGIAVDMGLGSSEVYVEGYRKGGVLCSWAGGSGTLHLNKANGEFHLYSVDQDGTPTLDIKSIKLGQFKMGQVSVLLPGDFVVSGQPPQWVNDFLTDSIDAVLSFILTSGLKKKFETYLGKKVRDLIEGGRGPLMGPDAMLPSQYYPEEFERM